MAGQTVTDEQFIRELHWCVEQLHLGLETQNPDSKQAREAQKTLKILCSDKAPVIKKRQAMRNTFGDYRQKMQVADKKSAAKLKKTKITPAIPDTSGYKSVFYKKSAIQQLGQSGGQPSTSQSGGQPSTSQSGSQPSTIQSSSQPSISQSGDGSSSSDSPNQISGNVPNAPSSMGDNSDVTGDISVQQHEDEVSERLSSISFVKSEGDFKFNFQSPESSIIVEDERCVGDVINQSDNLASSSVTSHSYLMPKSENSFRFNFDDPS